MLFSERSIWTMVHGIGLGGGALVGLAAALFYLYWKAREIAPGRIGAVTLILIAVGVLGTFPPVWALL